MTEQKSRLTTQNATQVLQALLPHLEAPGAIDSEAPVSQCHRYLLNRMDQLNYQDALNKNLPIGSGEIESAHRYVVQKRLKLAGAWWEIQNAEHMLALRINRANRKWDGHWGTLAGRNSLDTCTSV